MSTRNNMIVLGTAGLLLAALPVFAKSPKNVPETATIENSGSTNTEGYRIEVTAAGHAEYHSTERNGTVANGKAQSGKLPRSVAQTFFHDLAAAMPLTAMPARHGMRSASFGTATFITYKGQRSPDLTFPGNAQAMALKADIAAITTALHIGNAPRRPALMHPLSLRELTKKG